MTRAGRASRMRATARRRLSALLHFPVAAAFPVGLAAWLLLLPALPAAAGDEPFTFPSNAGLTGLLETPTARVLSENRYRIGAGVVSPYSVYYGSLSPYRRIEVNGRITAIEGVPGFFQGSPYGRYKDKAVDLKFQLVPEGKYLPAVAVAIFDPHGTRLFASQAVVASKQVFPFDFSFGFGNGRLGNKPLPAQGEGFKLELFTNPRAWWKDARPFGGIQFAPSGKWALVAEYSPIRYEKQTNDPAQPVHFRSKVPSPFNIGLRLKPFRWAEIDASWQRGNRFGLSASVSFEIGRPLIPIYDPPYREKPEDRARPLEGRVAAALLASGFSDVGVESDGETLRIEAQNDRYLFTARAEAVILEILARMDPERVEYVRIVLKENGIPRTEFVTTGHGIAELSSGGVTREQFVGFSRFRTDVSATDIRETTGKRYFDYDVKPQLDTFLNDPSGFFRYRLGATAAVRAYPWRGGSAILGLEGYPINTVSTSNAPLSIPVRSDVADYKKEKIALARLMGEQIVKLPGELYARLAAGLLEVMYGGIDGEIALPVLHGRFLLGASGSRVRKRAPDDPFGFKKNADYHTAFGTARLNVPEIQSWLDVKVGRFLAGDRGARVEVSKSINGVVLSAWYGWTGTSIFQDPFNRGYHDKGISVSIPIRLFLGRDSKTVYRFALSPWTRDVAQDIDRPRSLFDYIGRDTGVFLDRDRKSLFTVGKQ